MVCSQQAMHFASPKEGKKEHPPTAAAIFEKDQAIHRIHKWRRAERPSFEFMKTRLSRPEKTLKPLQTCIIY